MSLGESRLSVNLNGTKSWPEIVDESRRGSAVREAGRMGLRARLAREQVERAALPVVRGFQTHAALSAATPDTPSCSSAPTGHAYIVNAKVMLLMAMAGYEGAPKAARSSATRRTADRRPRRRMRCTSSSFPPSSDARRVQALDLALEESLRNGVTSFHDAGSSAEDIALFRRYADKHKLGPRIYVMISGYELLHI